HPAGVLRGGGHRRRGKLARPGERDAPAAPADHRVSGGRELDRLPAHLRLRLQHDERPGRAARFDQAAGPQDLRDRLRPLPDGLRCGPDCRPLRDPPRHLAPAAPAAALGMSLADARTTRRWPGRSIAWGLLLLGGVLMVMPLVYMLSTS